MDGLKKITGRRSVPVEVDPKDVEIIDPKKGPDIPSKTGGGADKLASAVADNFSQILSLASSIAEIKKMRVQSETVIKQMEEQRKLLITEAESYAIKKNADTNDVVEKMKIVREMMCDYYKYSGNANISGEDFRMIITDIVSNMNKVSNG